MFACLGDRLIVRGNELLLFLIRGKIFVLNLSLQIVLMKLTNRSFFFNWFWHLLGKREERLRKYLTVDFSVW